MKKCNKQEIIAGLAATIIALATVITAVALKRKNTTEDYFEDEFEEEEI